MKSTKRYKNVSKALAYTWHGIFSDSSMDNTACERPRYKNCRIVKFALDAIDCDLRRTIREVAGMAGISKYTAQHTLTLDLRMFKGERSLNSIECLKLLINLSFTLRKWCVVLF